MRGARAHQGHARRQGARTLTPTPTLTLTLTLTLTPTLTLTLTLTLTKAGLPEKPKEEEAKPAEEPKARAA